MCLNDQAVKLQEITTLEGEMTADMLETFQKRIYIEHDEERNSMQAIGKKYDPASSDHGKGTNHGKGEQSRRGVRRKGYELRTTKILEAWFLDHLSDPYPNYEQKMGLANAVGLSCQQISTWFNNNRRRRWVHIDVDNAS
ncbi:unnamed protein product [Choristocarpus tenellus]